MLSKKHELTRPLRHFTGLGATMGRHHGSQQRSENWTGTKTSTVGDEYTPFI